MAKSPWLGLLAVAGGLGYLALPHSETYSDYGLGINSVDIECGNSFDDKVDVRFENADEQYYWSEYDRIFDGKTAEEVCQKLDGDARPVGWGLTAVGGIWFVGGLAASKSRRSPAPVHPAGTAMAAPPRTVAAASSTQIQNPPRWVADPTGRFQMRYWDGKRWTQHVANGGTTGTDPLTTVARSTPLAAAAAVGTGVAEPPSDPIVRSEGGSLADRDGRTISRASLAAARAPAFVLRFDDGTAYEINGGTLIGRNPEPARGEEPYRCIAIADATSTVSKTHLLVEMANGFLTVTDRHSSNGTTVQTLGGPLLLPPLEATKVEPGMRVELGDRWFTLESGAT